MTALEKLLKARGVVSLSGDALSGPNVVPITVAKGSSDNPVVHNVDEPSITGGDPTDPDDQDDAKWQALQSTLTEEAPTISTAIDTAGQFSDLQSAVAEQNPGRLQIALYQFMAAARMTYTSAAVDAAVARTTNAVQALLNADTDSDGDDVGMPVSLSGPQDVEPISLAWDKFDALRPKGKKKEPLSNFDGAPEGHDGKYPSTKPGSIAEGMVKRAQKVSAFRDLNDKAHEATDAARQGPENTYEAHKKAADLHERAGKMASDLGMHSDAEDHAAKAKQHGDVAKSLAKKEHADKDQGRSVPTRPYTGPSQRR